MIFFINFLRVYGNYSTQCRKTQVKKDTFFSSKNWFEYVFTGFTCKSSFQVKMSLYKKLLLSDYSIIQFKNGKYHQQSRTSTYHWADFDQFKFWGSPKMPTFEQILPRYPGNPNVLAQKMENAKRIILGKSSILDQSDSNNSEFKCRSQCLLISQKSHQKWSFCGCSMFHWCWCSGKIK